MTTTPKQAREDFHVLSLGVAITTDTLARMQRVGSYLLDTEAALAAKDAEIERLRAALAENAPRGLIVESAPPIQGNAGSATSPSTYNPIHDWAKSSIIE